MSRDLPKAIAEHHFEIAGVKLIVFVLDDGQRIIGKEGAEELIAKFLDGSADVSDYARMQLLASEAP